MGTNFNINNEFKRLNYSFLKAQKYEGGLLMEDFTFGFYIGNWLAINVMRRKTEVGN